MLLQVLQMVAETSPSNARQYVTLISAQLASPAKLLSVLHCHLISLFSLPMHKTRHSHISSYVYTFRSCQNIYGTLIHCENL